MADEIVRTIRIPKRVYDQLKLVSDYERRSINGEIVKALEKWVEQKNEENPCKQP